MKTLYALSSVALDGARTVNFFDNPHSPVLRETFDPIGFFKPEDTTDAIVSLNLPDDWQPSECSAPVETLEETKAWALNEVGVSPEALEETIAKVSDYIEIAGEPPEDVELEQQVTQQPQQG